MSRTRFRTAALYKASYKILGARRARINPAVSLKLPQQALLQQLAYGNVRLHAVRSALRVMVLLIVDSACIAVALGVAIALRPGTEIGFYGLSTLSLHAFEVPSALLAGLFLAGNYRAGYRRGRIHRWQLCALLGQPIPRGHAGGARCVDVCRQPLDAGVAA